MNFDHKIIPLSALSTLSERNAQKTVLVGGCFDVMHYGHLSFLQKARLAGDFLIVLLESDSFIETIKKKKPVHTQRQRAEILAAIGYTDSIVLLPKLESPDKDYMAIVKQIHPQVIAYTAGDTQEKRKKELAKLVSSSTYEIPYLSSFSSSQLITYAHFLRD